MIRQQTERWITRQRKPLTLQSLGTRVSGNQQPIFDK